MKESNTLRLVVKFIIINAMLDTKTHTARTFFLPTMSPSLEIHIEPTNKPENINDPKSPMNDEGAHIKSNYVIQLLIVSGDEKSIL